MAHEMTAFDDTAAGGLKAGGSEQANVGRVQPVRPTGAQGEGGTPAGKADRVASLVPPLRVLVVCPAGVLGGAEGWLLSALDNTVRWQVEVLLLQDGPLRFELERRGLSVRLLRVGRRPLDLALAVPSMVREMGRHQPDVVLANGVKAALVAATAGLVTGTPVVWAKHDHSYDEQIAVPLGKLCTRVVAAVEELGEPVRRDDVVVVPPPRPAAPPLDRVAARAAWAAAGLSLDGRPTAVALGRVVAYKGVDDAVRALALPGGQGWRLAVVGNDDPSAPGSGAALQVLAERLGVADRVVRQPALPAASRLLSAFDALLVLTKPTGDPRSPSKEGFGTTAFEAMLAGIPVVAVGGGAVARRLAGTAGVSVQPGAPQDVAAALAHLASARARSVVGQAGRKLLADHPDAASTAELLVQVLAQAAGRPGAGLASGPAMTVVTPVLNEAAGVDALLGVLAPQLRAQDEVIVVDGGSTDDTAQVVRAWQARDRRIRLLEAPGTNIPAARNAAARHVRTEWVAATDVGCTPLPGWLDALRAAAADGAPTLVTGTYRVIGERRFDAAMAVVGYPDPDEVRRPGLLVRAYGAAFGRTFDPSMPTNRSNAVLTSASQALGGYDETLTTGEDVVWGRALVRAGGKAVMSADAEVAWAQRPSLRATARMYQSYGYGDGLSGDRRLVGRDLARLAAYGLGPVLLLAGGRAGKLLGGIGAACYLSLPLARAMRRPAPLRTAALIPAAAGLRDLAKAAGCVQGLWARHSRTDPSAVTPSSGAAVPAGLSRGTG